MSNKQNNEAPAKKPSEGDVQKKARPSVSELNQVKDMFAGESLQPCSDAEWEQSECAYSADLLNVKKDVNKVTVFAAPEKATETTGAPSIRQAISLSRIDKVEQKPVDNDPVSALARLISGVARQLLENREKTLGVEVTISMKLCDGETKEVKIGQK